jgi:hypothetical protein
MKKIIFLFLILLISVKSKSQIVLETKEFYKFKVESNLDLLVEFSKDREIELEGGTADCKFTFDTLNNIVTVENKFDSTIMSYPIVFKDFSNPDWVKIMIKSTKYGYCNYLIVNEPNVGKVIYNYWNEGKYNRGWQSVVL